MPRVIVDFRSFHKLFDIDGPDFMECEVPHLDPLPGMVGRMNPFYGKHHTPEHCRSQGERIRKWCQDNPEESLRVHSHKGSTNGMYGSSRKGAQNPFFGRTHTAATKALLRQRALERYRHSSNPMKGTTLSVERKLEIGERNSREFTLVSPEGHIIIIKNAAKYAREHRLSEQMLIKVAKGKAKLHKGYTTPP